ncbi:Hypothetical predicted protein [Olea europaea subsp. europaea]|uniref:Dirigent protein n=1 Tax=Olea europaea subsp. europaea TaxID=158383 RepID=A0A8S0RF35_OLEEU|nr:Hypothetical predicted protein [Olea europaea subsp. europaea]
MGKLSIISVLFVNILAMSGVFADAHKVTKLHFYVQDLLSGPNKTVWDVARTEITSTSPTLFGQVRVIDDLITTKPDANSKKLGRVQGQITFADLEEVAPLMNLNVVFKSGIYSGSTICMLGRNPISEQYREYAIVGGSGIFRMAQGYAITSIYSNDTATGHFVLEYKLYVVYEIFGKSSKLFNR